MSPSILLSEEQIQQFIEYGFVHLTDCFDRDFAGSGRTKRSRAWATTRTTRRPGTKPIIHMPTEDLCLGQGIRAESLQRHLPAARRRGAHSGKSALGQRLHRQFLARRRPRMDSAFAGSGRLAQGRRFLLALPRQPRTGAAGDRDLERH